MGFDIDGVLCSIIPECVAKGKQWGVIPEHIEVTDIYTDIRKQFNWPEGLGEQIFNADFYMSLPPHMDVIKSIKKWQEDGHYIVFITARRPEKGVGAACVDWLDRQNVLEKSSGCLHTDSGLKYQLAEELELQVFVDDYPKVIRNMIGKVPYPFLLEGPINKDCDDLQVYKWSEIEAIIEHLMNE